MNSDTPIPKLDNITVVLSHPTEMENVGGTARAMKNMGLSKLTVIAPKGNPYGRPALARAHGAEDLLRRARTVMDLKSAIGNARLVAGTTARRRELRKHAVMSPDRLARKLLEHSAHGEVVLMFGTERTGLTNEEVYACRYVSRIDADASQSSLNLAQAVLLYGYELRRAWREMIDDGAPAPARPPEMHVSHPHRSTKPPTQRQLDTMYGHLGAVMEAVGYSEEEQAKFLTYLRHLHMRAGIVDWEQQIYHLLARKVLYALGRPPYQGGE